MDSRDRRIAKLPPKIWALINQIDELKGQWVGGARLNPQALGRLKRSVLITSSGASTRIEGAELSDDDVERLMRGLAMTRLADRDKQEVRGYYELLEDVFASWSRLAFSESTIKSFHKELLQYVAKDTRHRGEYKKQENRVEMFDARGEPVGTVFETTPAYLTPKQMHELVAWTREALRRQEAHPLVIIANFILEFLAIHPFQDGNGRLARILTNLLMLQGGYAYVPYVSHEKLVENRKPDYYLALRRSQVTLRGKKPNILPWLEFFLEVAREQTRQAIALLSHEQIDKLLSPKQLAVWEAIAREEEISSGEIARTTGIPHPTVSQALNVLLRLKKIERFGQGRATRYRKIS